MSGILLARKNIDPLSLRILKDVKVPSLYLILLSIMVLYIVKIRFYISKIFGIHSSNRKLTILLLLLLEISLIYISVGLQIR
jgi:hypothetical protein